MFVVAAHNHDQNLDDPTTPDSSKWYPAKLGDPKYNLSNVVVVAATEEDDHFAHFVTNTGQYYGDSNYGAISVDLAAPGDHIYTTTLTNNGSNAYAEDFGTSLATPMVSGAISLALSMKPDLTISQVTTALTGHGIDAMPQDNRSTKRHTASDGRLNIFRYLRYIAENYLTYNYKNVILGDDGANPINDTILIFRDSDGTTKVTRNNVTIRSGIPTTDSIGVFGLGGNDRIEISPNVNNPVYINGGTGNDTIVGGNGNDTLIGENGDDSITAGSGDDDVSGGNGIDYIDGGAGKDTLHGNSDYDYILGGSGNDQIFGDDGDDRLFGGADNDSIRGGIGADTLYGDSGADTVYGDDGDDRFFSNHDTTHDELHGGLGVDKVSAAEIDTVATGGQAADLVDSVTVI